LRAGLSQVTLVDLSGNVDDAREEFTIMFPGAKILSYRLDVAKEDDVKRAFDKALQKMGRLDIAVLVSGATLALYLLNQLQNAGVAHARADTHELDSKVFDRTMQVNLYG
jgi:NAD(P)-dependent dehydrogenase (short-subunit alcohol dehydrogenase family)